MDLSRSNTELGGHRLAYTSPGRHVRIYPNVIELWQDEERVIAYSPEEWALIVQTVGIKGLHP